MSDRTEYMRKYMRERRKKAKDVAANQKEVSTELPEDRLRAIIREEMERAVAPIMDMLTKLTVSNGLAERDGLTGLTVNTVNTPVAPDMADTNQINYQARLQRMIEAETEQSRAKAVAFSNMPAHTPLPRITPPRDVVEKMERQREKKEIGTMEWDGKLDLVKKLGEDLQNAKPS